MDALYKELTTQRKHFQLTLSNGSRRSAIPEISSLNRIDAAEERVEQVEGTTARTDAAYDEHFATVSGVIGNITTLKEEVRALQEAGVRKDQQNQDLKRQLDKSDRHIKERTADLDRRMEARSR